MKVWYYSCPKIDVLFMNLPEGRVGMSERFPEIDWWCDRCGAYLNDQDGFDDHKYIWKCTECGHKNSISASNIYESHEDYLNVIKNIFEKE